MPTIPLSNVLIQDRQRYDLGDLERLAESLRDKGQIHAILLRQDDSRLVAGGRRCAATELLFTRGETIRGLPLGHIRYEFRESLTDEELQELELEENLRRKGITWQEQCLAIAKIHALKQKGAALGGSSWGQRETGEMLSMGLGPVNTALKLAYELTKDNTRNGPIWTAETPAEAVQKILQRQIDEAQAELARRTITNTPSENVDSLAAYGDLDDGPPGDLDSDEPAVYKEVTAAGTRLPLFQWTNQQEAQLAYARNPLNKDPYSDYVKKSLDLQKKAENTIRLGGMLRHTDCIDYMLSAPPVFDHIITDIPYGIDMENLQQQNTGMDVGTVVEEHDVGENTSLMSRFFPAAFHCLKDTGFCVTWCDQMLWQYMYDEATKAGFKVQRWPLTWVKMSPCMNQAAQYNFTKSTEIAMVCRKPGAQLIQKSPVSVVICGHDELKEELGHPFVKPFAVWEFIANHVSMQGQLILEPFAGRGSGVISLLRMGRRVIACEKQENHFNHLIENVKRHYTKTIGEFVQFEW